MRAAAAIAHVLCGALPACSVPAEAGGQRDDLAWLEAGSGTGEFSVLKDGGALTLGYGLQGAPMFALQFRGGGFALPAKATDSTDPRAPLLDVSLDVEGMTLGVEAYPVAFRENDEGTYEFSFLALLVPDEVDPPTLDGQTALLSVRLVAYERDPLDQQYTVTVAFDEP